MLTIEEIKKLKTLGKRKWGNSLIHFLKDKFIENLSSESICNFLAESYQIELSPNCLNKLRSKYFFIEQHTNIQSSKPIEAKEDDKLKIVQKKDYSNAESLYQKIYPHEKPKNEFDLGDDF
jgi:transcriptional regulatory protein LevR